MEYEGGRTDLRLFSHLSLPLNLRASKDSGSSTRSWIGILQRISLILTDVERLPTPGQRWHRASCFFKDQCRNGPAQLGDSLAHAQHTIDLLDS